MKKLNWRKGNGELIGFAASLALFLLMCVAIMTFASFTMKSEQLTVTAYCAGRAAALAQTEDLAKQRADAVMKAMCREMPYEMEIKIVDGDKWEKGNLFKINVSQEFPDAYQFINGFRDMHRELTMMIEGETLEWKTW